MQTLSQNLMARAKVIIDKVNQDGIDPLNNKVQPGQEDKSVRILNKIVVFTHSVSSEQKSYTLGYELKGEYYPSIEIGPNDISILTDNWDFAKNIICHAEKQLGLCLEQEAKTDLKNL